MGKDKGVFPTGEAVDFFHICEDDCTPVGFLLRPSVEASFAPVLKADLGESQSNNLSGAVSEGLASRS